MLAIYMFFVSINSMKLKTKIIMPIIISCYSTKQYNNSRRVVMTKGLRKCTSETLCNNSFLEERNYLGKRKTVDWKNLLYGISFLKSTFKVSV